MNIFVYKAVFNWGKESWCPVDLREHMEYGRQELGRRGSARASGESRDSEVKVRNWTLGITAFRNSRLELLDNRSY